MSKQFSLLAEAEADLCNAQVYLELAEIELRLDARNPFADANRRFYRKRVEGLEAAIRNMRWQSAATQERAAICGDLFAPSVAAPGITLQLADKAEQEWAQAIIVRDHYLHAQVDPRSSPICYMVNHQAAWGAAAAAGPRVIGLLFFGRPESTRCYDGGMTYGSVADMLAGRAQFERWEVLNLARVWFHPQFQAGGLYCQPNELPGYTDRRGVWRSTLASTAICAALARVGYDYLRLRPPVDCDFPYQIRVALSYCDTRIHRGALYRASGFGLARRNQVGIETWWTSAVAPLSPEQDMAIRRISDLDDRARRIRAQRAQLELDL